MKTALITGSAGLIGSACAKLLLAEGWRVIGLDNDGRARYFGEAASTVPVQKALAQTNYTHVFLDIRDREYVNSWVAHERPNFIIHAAGQPSHDLSARIPFVDWDVNATGTMNLLMAAKEHVPASPFAFLSTNKVYGDRPNFGQRRHDFGQLLVDETMSIDQSLHSPFGVSKLAADLMCQEFGRYFGMFTGIFRCGCITGANHAAVALHGFLAYLVDCAVNNKPYVIYGYEGKQVRDQLDADDLAKLLLMFYHDPKQGEVYNVGGGKGNSVSILDVIEMLKRRGYEMVLTYDPTPRKGDHICYITDLTKVRRDYPDWRITKSVSTIMDEIIEAKRKQGRQVTNV